MSFIKQKFNASKLTRVDISTVIYTVVYYPRAFVIAGVNVIKLFFFIADDEAN